MVSNEIDQNIWSEVEGKQPSFDEAMHLVELDEEEYLLVAQEETDDFFRKVRKEERKKLKELEEYLSAPDSTEN